MPAEKQFYLSMCISNGICQVYFDLLAVRSLIKWPNDILINGKKIAGILIENTLWENLHTSVIGIGLNVNQKSFPAEIPNPVSLCMKPVMNFAFAGST